MRIVVRMVLLAAGRGERMGFEIPKLALKIRGKSILEMALEMAQNCRYIDEVVLVVGDVLRYVDVTAFDKVKRIVEGGRTRRESVARGVRYVGSDDVVLIHDAARPFASCELVKRIIEKTTECGAAVPVIPLRDTVVRVREGEVTESLVRRELRAVQTPQGFIGEIIKRAHDMAMKEKGIDDIVTDDSALVIRYSLSEVCVVDGETTNIKITYPEDLKISEVLLSDL